MKTEFETILEQAYESQASGRLDEARAGYAAASRIDATSALPPYLLGCLAIQTGNAGDALEQLGRAIERDSSFADAHLLIGRLLSSASRHAEAARHLEAAQAMRPDDVDIRIQLGWDLRALGQTEGAERAYRAVLERDPTNALANGRLGMLLYELDRHAEAEAAIRMALAVEPGNGDLFELLALSLAGLRRAEEAVEAYRMAIQLDPARIESKIALSRLLQQLRRFEEAEPIARQAYAADPAFAPAVDALATALVGCRRQSDAEILVRRALLADPNSSALRSRLTRVLLEADRPRDAELEARNWLALGAEQPQAYMDLGQAIASQGRWEEALQHTRHAVKIGPGQEGPLYNLWNALLRAARYGEGLRVYRMWAKADRFDPLPVPIPIWNGDPAPNGRLLVYADHGLGDTMQFARFVTLAKPRFQGYVTFACAACLVPLLRGVRGPDAVISKSDLDAGSVNAFDARIGLVDLAALLDPELDRLPSLFPYIDPPCDWTERWRNEFATRRGLRVGVSWLGDPRNGWQRPRSCPASLMAGLAGSNRTLVSMVKGESPPTGCEAIVDLHDRLSDFSEIAAMDLIITVDTSVAHLAGAIGKPTWVVLPKFAPWMWLTERSDSEWYPTARLFRQTRLGDWLTVFAEVADALERFERETNDRWLRR